MTIRFQTLSLRFVAILVFSLLAILGMPRFVSAEAGSGGGGGSEGCSQYQYSTCYGAVWRYYQSTSNSFPIKNVGAGYTYVTNCGSTGGFFAYVLPQKAGGGGTRSWVIGPADGNSGNRSVYFGGWTKYRGGDGSGTAPTNPTSGDYGWYDVRAAFEQTVALGQGNGYQWNGSSTLGWFCYRGTSFNLTPSITGSPKDIDGSTNEVQLIPTVANAGPTGSSNVEWRVTTFRLAPGVAEPVGGTGSGVPASYYGNSATDIKSGTRQFPRNTTNLQNELARQAIGDYPVGTKICYGLSVRPYSHTTGNWRYSKPFCIIVTKKPKFQVLGSDVLVGRPFPGAVAQVSKITAGETNQISRTYGSWVEYAAVATGTITGFASASGYAGGVPRTTDCGVAFLTLANTSAASPSRCSSTSSLGSFDTKKTIPDIASRFSTSSTTTKLTGAVDLGGSNRQGIYTIDDNAASIDLSATTLKSGQWVVINAPTKTVNITGDIKYTDGVLNAPSDIPQLVIIANRINIRSSVARVDAWLVAKGTEGLINTCRDAADNADLISLSSTMCAVQLTVNGPVMAKKLVLNRTSGAGAGTAAGTPGEIFNLRPDAYIWAATRASTTGRVQTVYTQELPPRF